MVERGNKREAGTGQRVGLQVALAVAGLLLLVVWHTQRSPVLVAPPQQQLYVNDLTLPLDVGTVEHEVRRRAFRFLPASLLISHFAGTLEPRGPPSWRIAAATNPYCCCLQDEADLWCAPRPAPSWPPTDSQLRQLRVAIVIDPVCRRWAPQTAAKCAAAPQSGLLCGAAAGRLRA